MIRLEKLSYVISGQKLCDNISYEVKKNCLTGLVGPNGSGKTTLLKQIYRVYKPSNGAVYIDGKNLMEYTHKESAQKTAVMAQEADASVSYSVEDVVLMGRAPHHNFFGRQTNEDFKIMEKALKKVGMYARKDQKFFTLSGGEKQRVLLARALAQSTEILILDEPSNHMDIGHQYRLFELLTHLNKTIFTSVHDLNLALKFCDELIVLDHGKIVAEGAPSDVLTKDLLRSVFSIDCKIYSNDDGVPEHIEFTSSF